MPRPATSDPAAWETYCADLDRIAAGQAAEQAHWESVGAAWGHSPPTPSGPTLLRVIRGMPCEPGPDVVDYHEAAHLLVAIRIGVPTGSASVNAAGGMVTVDPEFIDGMDTDPTAIPRLAAVQAAGAIGSVLYHSDYDADPRSHLSEQDARNVDRLKARWEADRPGEPWPCPFTHAARVLGDDAVYPAVYPLAKLLHNLGGVTPTTARVLLAEVEAEALAAAPFK